MPSSDQYFFDKQDYAVKAILPNFAAKKAAGVLPVLPYERTVVNGAAMCVVRASAEQIGPTGPSSKYEAIHAFSATPLSIGQVIALNTTQKSIAQNEAKARFASHIENVQVQVITEVGEAKESLQLISKTLKLMNIFSKRQLVKNGRLLRSAAKKLKASVKDPREMYKLSNDLVNMYLEFNYGWKPMYNTFANACEVYAGVHGRPRTKVSGKGVYLDSKDTLSAYQNVGTSSGAGQVRFLTTTTYKYQCWYGGLLNGVYGTDLRSQLGLNANEIIPSLWDLVKFSFVLDYFTNISDVIGNLKNSTQRMNPETLYLTEKIQYSVTKQLNDWKPLAGGAGYSYPGRGNMIHVEPYTMMYFHRVPVTASGLVVTFNFKDPSWTSIGKTLALAFANFNGAYMRR